jgi:hypothetical protein
VEQTSEKCFPCRERKENAMSSELPMFLLQCCVLIGLAGVFLIRGAGDS